jgi:hypothetical protein
MIDCLLKFLFNRSVCFSENLSSGFVKNLKRTSGLHEKTSKAQVITRWLFDLSNLIRTVIIHKNGFFVYFVGENYGYELLRITLIAVGILFLFLIAAPTLVLVLTLVSTYEHFNNSHLRTARLCTTNDGELKEKIS